MRIRRLEPRLVILRTGERREQEQRHCRNEGRT
jgi:hypothetical protein